MDSVFEIPGLGIRFGIDALVGLVPGLGDALTSIASLHILNTAHGFGVSRITMLRMASNIAIDYVFGSLPLLGDAFDVYWKANNRNVALLRQHFAGSPEHRRRAERSDLWFMILLIVLLTLLLIVCIGTAWFLVAWLFQLFVKPG